MSEKRVSFIVQRLDGYTEWRPSWLKVARASTREDAAKKAEEYQRVFPNAKLRIRQVRR